MEPNKEKIEVEIVEDETNTVNLDNDNKKKKKKEKVKKEKKPKTNRRNTINQQKANIKDKVDDEIDKATKEMEDLLESINEMQGNEGGQVKVLKIELPKPSFKAFFIELLMCLLINTLIIVGTSGFFTFITYKNILDLVLFSVYYTLVDRILTFLFIRFFTPFIIRTLGIGGVIPTIVALVICFIFPIFVGIENIVVFVLTMIFVCVCRSFFLKYFRNLMIKNRINRRMKK